MQLKIWILKFFLLRYKYNITLCELVIDVVPFETTVK
jgi:hypothetical protein